MTGYWKAHYVPHRKAPAYIPDITLGGRQYVLIEYRWYVTKTAKVVVNSARRREFS